MTSTLTLARLVAVSFALVAAAGCGGDDGDDEGATDTTAATEETTETTAEEASNDPGSGGGELPDCPEPPAVSDAIGVEVVVDEDAPIAVEGFCTYIDPTGDPIDALSVNYTFSPLDITGDPVDSWEPVDGIGERAFWSDFEDTMIIWAGDYGVLVQILNTGASDQDPLDIATAMAGLVA